MKVNGKDFSIYYKNMFNLFQTTNQYVYMYIYIYPASPHDMCLSWVSLNNLELSSYCWAILPQAAGHKLAWNSRSRPTSHWSPSPKALNQTDGEATNTTGGVKRWNRKCQKLHKRWLSVSLSDWVDCTIPNAWLSDLFFWLGWSLWRSDHVTSAKTYVHKYQF